MTHVEDLAREMRYPSDCRCSTCAAGAALGAIARLAERGGPKLVRREPPSGDAAHAIYGGLGDEFDPEDYYMAVFDAAPAVPEDVSADA